MRTKEQVDAQADALIAQYGWMIQGVFSNDDEPGFAYTIGLAAKGLPELIVFAMPLEFARATLNTLAQRMVNGDMPALNTRLTDIFDGADAQLIETSGTHASRYMFQAERRYPDYRALQLVWTDPQRRFPWEEGYAERFVKLQPLLRPTLQ